MDYRIVGASEARSCIAGLIVPPADELNIGDVRLHPHQADAVARMGSAIARYGGALLCDPVGTGKTFSALGLASRYESVTVVAPALLESMWIGAALRTSVKIRFISHESLSRMKHVERTQGLVIVDEAHHARNPATRRFQALARLVHGADVLLMTATPVHNRPKDLRSLQSLYLGDRAALLTASEVADTVIRRSEAVMAAPAIAPIEWLTVAHDRDVPGLIIDLPPALPLRDGGVADVLVRHSLVRQWASSNAALRLALRRRCARAGALIAALESGRYPGTRELSSWAIGDDAVQLAFPELVCPATEDATELLRTIRRHLVAIEELAASLRHGRDRDVETAALIRQLVEKHRGVPAVAFSSYEETVMTLYRMLAPYGRVAAIAGRGGKVAGGAISRREVIERFAPAASGCPPPRKADQVSLLLATDLLSEGVNLQDGGVIIHLDLPFTNARLEQRVGRLARLGSRHERIHSYAFRPPAPAETIGRIETILGMKLSFGMESRVVPEAAAEVTRRLKMWGGKRCATRIVSAVRSGRTGFLAVAGSSDHHRLISGDSSGVREDPAALLAAIGIAEGPQATVSAGEIDRILRMIEAHLALDVSVGAAIPPRLEKLHRKIGRTLRDARQHERSTLLPLANRARASIGRSGGAALDSTFSSLLESTSDDAEFLASVADIEFIRKERDPVQERVLALIVFVPPAT
jgi:hypothetical protein